MTFNVSIVMCKWIKLVVISSEMLSKKENVCTSGRLMAPTPKFSLCNILFLFLTLSHGRYSVLTGGCFQGLIQVRFHRTDVLYNHCIEEFWRKLKTLILKPMYYSGFKTFWPVQSNQNVINTMNILNSRNKDISIFTFDFLTLYTEIHIYHTINWNQW